MNTHALIEDVEFLLDAGEGSATIARRVGYARTDTLTRLLDHEGRHDLAVRLRLPARAMA